MRPLHPLLPLALLLLAPHTRGEHQHDSLHPAPSHAPGQASSPVYSQVHTKVHSHVHSPVHSPVHSQTSSQAHSQASSTRPTMSHGSSVRRITQHAMTEPPCAGELPLPLRPRRGPLALVAVPPPPPRDAPRASPRSDSTDLMVPAPATRRGYYGHEVGYGSYFPIGLDPLTILAGLAFLAFIIQTLYLLLYKHYGLGLGVGAGAGVGIGPLSADRHQREREQQVWANSLASRIDSTASRYEDSSNATDSRPSSGEPVATGGQQEASAEPEAESEARQAGRAGHQRGPSPLDALLAMLRRSWGAGARSCGPSWLCRLMHFARLLTEPLGGRPTAGRS